MAIAAVGAWVAANAATIATTVSVASSIAAGIQARGQAKAQEAHRKQQNELAMQSMRDQFKQLSAAEADARERTLQESISNQEEYAKRRARVNLMAAASGTGGLSVDSMMQDLKRDKGRNLNTIIKNQEIELSGFRNQAEAIRTGTQARIDNRKIRRPSWAEVGISTATAGVQGYMTGTDIQSSLGNGGNPASTVRTQSNYQDVYGFTGGV